MKNFPHTGVFARLRVSKLHGVGVFALVDIPKGTYVFADDDQEIVWVDENVVEALPDPIKQLYYEFAIIKHNKSARPLRYGAPRTFNDLTISWYVNHSEQPNLAADKEYRFYALRRIAAGEELTADYRTYSELPPGSV